MALCRVAALDGAILDDEKGHGRRAGISSVQSSGLLDRITGAWDNPAKPLAREGAMLAFAALVKQLGEAGEPYLLPLMPKLLERYADKVLQTSSMCGGDVVMHAHT